LGSHSKKSRLSRSAKAAAPALAGVAAAICLSPQAFADTSAHQVTAHQTAALDAASQPAVQPAQLMADLVRAKQRNSGAQHKPAALPTRYTIRSGDSLSSIANRFYQNPDAWPVLYWANHSKIRWANIIAAGQVLRVPVKPARIPGPPAELGPPAPKPVAAPVQQAAPAPVRHSYATAQVPAVTTSTYSGGTPGGSFGACVVARESGGNAQVMNGSGHYGLYQFSASTWAAYGGNPAAFGHASVSEQNQVFSNALARGGQSNWSPYDGC
jgi:LysM repeat protein